MRVLDALFPKVRIEVLRALYRDPEKEIHVRELARQAQLSLGPIQRELANLLEAELVCARKDGNRLYFRANRVNPVYQDLRSVFVRCGGEADVLASALKNIEGIDVAFIFGSVAKETNKVQSDLDLMVIGMVGLRTIAGALRAVGEELGLEINPYVLSNQTWSEKLNQKDTFITRVNDEEKVFIIGTQNSLN